MPSRPLPSQTLPQLTLYQALILLARDPGFSQGVLRERGRRKALVAPAITLEAYFQYGDPDLLACLHRGRSWPRTSWTQGALWPRPWRSF
ncbi:MAG: hypothetical protein P3W93_005825 [Thermus sp.]|nr:hypothetical protein [Thermus sp.]